MDEIKVVNLEEVLNILGTKVLNDKDFAKAELVNAVVEKAVELDEVSFSFGGSGNFNIQLFNSEDDTDEDKIVSLGAESILNASPDQAWLKYQVKSDLKASAGIELSKLGFDINGEKSLVFNSYRLHPNTTDALRKSVLSDFQPFLFIANLNHVLALKANEVLSVRLPGKLSLAVSVSWSDIFTGALSLFQSILKAGQVLNFELSASVEVNFNIEVEDDFSLHIRKNTDKTYQVYISKTSSKKAGGDFAAGIEVGFQDKDATKKILGSVAEGLTDKVAGRIQPILDKNPLTKLSEPEKEIVKALGEELGFNTEVITTVFDLENALGERLTPVIEKIATSKIKLGFAYEYNRVSSAKEILQAVLDEDAMKTYHPALIRFKLEDSEGFKGLLSDLRAGEVSGKPLKGVTLVNYLNEKTVVRKQAWGFSLGLGKWVVAGKDHVETKEVIRQNASGNRQVAFAGTRGYDGNFFGNEHNWTVDFNAEMGRFSQAPVPLVNELKYSLYLLMEWKRKNNFNKENIRHIVDQAVLWKVLEEKQYAQVFDQLAQQLTGKKIKNVNASVHLKFSPDIFPVVFNNISLLIRDKPWFNVELIARSMSAAMTRLDDASVRSTVEKRINTYAPLWKACLLKPDKTENDKPIEQEERIELGFAARTQLLKFGEKLMAAEEIEANSMNTFSGLLAGMPGIRKDWSFFKNGIVTLNNGFNQGLIYDEVVKKSFGDLQTFWDQDHYVRTMGYYLLSFTNNAFLMQGVDRSLTISYELEGEKKVINMIGN
jgi:hypothetical protein